MIDKNFKIILFQGGFAGDLITSLYNPNVFERFRGNVIDVNKRVLSLKSKDFIRNSHTNKLKYIESIMHMEVCSSHDVEFSLRLKEHTILVYCSDHKLAKFFLNRINRNVNNNLLFDDYMNWQDNSRQIYKRQIDLKNLSKPTLLEDLGINDSRSADILKQWLELNKYD